MCARRRQAELAADSTVQCSNGVPRQADKWCEEPAMAFAFPQASLAMLPPLRVQSRAASREYRVGEEGHEE